MLEHVQEAPFRLTESLVRIERDTDISSLATQYNNHMVSLLNDEAIAKKRLRFFERLDQLKKPGEYYPQLEQSRIFVAKLKEIIEYFSLFRTDGKHSIALFGRTEVVKLQAAVQEGGKGCLVQNTQGKYYLCGHGNVETNNAGEKYHAMTNLEGKPEPTEAYITRLAEQGKIPAGETVVLATCHGADVPIKTEGYPNGVRVVLANKEQGETTVVSSQEASDGDNSVIAFTGPNPQLEQAA